MKPLENIVSLKSYFYSEWILILGILILVFFSMKKDSEKSFLPYAIAVGTLILSLLAVLQMGFSTKLSLFSGMISVDPFGQFFKVLILGTALIGAFFSEKSKDLENAPRPEFYAFLLTATLGLNVLSVSNDLLMIYLGIEMASIISYVLAGYLSESKRSEEAGLKYVFFGGMASGIMIFGLSLLYGLTGTLNLVEIREFLISNPTDRLVLFITFIMILAGLGYKMAVAPFHMWSPDVYEGAPLPVTAFLSVASKAGGFAVTVRFFYVAFTGGVENGSWIVLKSLDWQTLIAVLSAITMTIGNLTALQQTNIKRFLAYSSVAHAGYLLMGLAVQNTIGLEAILFYFMVYFLMNLGAFLVALVVANQFGTENMEDYKGLAHRNGFSFFMSFCLSIFLLSLAGLPPFAGFIGKWYIFSAVIKSGGLLWLAAIGAINSVISLFYYVRLMKYMMFDAPEGEQSLNVLSVGSTAIVSLFAALSLIFGLYFTPLVEWAKTSAQILQ